jgi:hypothetical protein
VAAMAGSGRGGSFMSIDLPRALEFELIADDYFQVKVGGHAFFYRIAPDRLSIVRCRVKRGGRGAHRDSKHYEESAFEFAWREAQARGLIRADAKTETAMP